MIDMRSPHHCCRECEGHFHGMCAFAAHGSDDAGYCGCKEAGAAPSQRHAHRHAPARCVSGQAGGTQAEEEEDDDDDAWLEVPPKPEPASELIAQGAGVRRNLRSARLAGIDPS
eukprot:jgi/Tetstr1/455000/TSEL_041858.t1